MSDVIKSSAALSFITSALPGLSVGHADPLPPFGGRMAEDDSRPLVSPDVPAEGVSVGHADGASGDGVYGLLRMILGGGKPCRVWGEPIPGDCCNRNGEIDPCKSRGKLCGAIVNYDVPIAGTEATASYQLKPNNWFLPLFWQDASSAETYVASITYQGKGFQAAPDANIYPAATYPLTIHNPIFGWPGVTNTQPLTFDLRADVYDSSRFFRGKFIGISYENF